MSDRELLEKAAKAAGLYEEPVHFNGHDSSISFGSDALHWDPLNDDSDAFRLMVHLGLAIDAGWAGGYSLTMQTTTAEDFYGQEKHGGDAYAATRRAIVTVAAAIGEQS